MISFMTTDVFSWGDCETKGLRRIRRKMKTVRPRMMKKAAKNKMKNQSNGNISFSQPEKRIDSPSKLCPRQEKEGVVREIPPVVAGSSPTSGVQPTSSSAMLVILMLNDLRRIRMDIVAPTAMPRSIQTCSIHGNALDSSPI